MAKLQDRRMMSDENTAITVADPFAKRLIVQYLERREQDLNALSSSLAEADFEAIALTAHRLYGSGSAYGLDEVSRLGGALEKAAESREANEIEALLGDLKRYLRQLKLN